MLQGRQLGLFDNPAPPAHPREEFPVAIRASGRARHLTLRFVPPHTLELIVPRRTRPQDVAAFLKEQQRWIDDARREIARVRGSADYTLPERIELRAIERVQPLRYRHVPGATAACRSRGDALELSTPDVERRAAPALLQAWLRAQGRAHLVPWLAREAARVGFGPQAVQVRLQKTRWGSCSSRGLISLNAGLLFVDPELVRYLFVHELCHLKHLNHSRRYWRLVERFEPDHEALDRRLADAWAVIPWWAYAKG
jgi:predicted metal-dependent hydrolase